MEYLFCTIIVDAHEGRNVDTFDVPGLYLHAYMPKYKRILMNLRAGFVDITCQAKPEYEQQTRYEYGKKVLYLLVLIEIYGCIDSALFWYKLFYTNLEFLGFEINIYDSCVANKVIEGTQYTTA